MSFNVTDLEKIGHGFNNIDGVCDLLGDFESLINRYNFISFNLFYSLYFLHFYRYYFFDLFNHIRNLNFLRFHIGSLFHNTF